LKKDEFVEEVFQIAFGHEAINKDYSYDEVIDQLLEFSEHALKYEESEGLI
jgi:hypothetical protein|tara:strand:+ start:187 stop:339 length:153 start_codon:yes stop_codon:yes gene_type:complete